MDRLLNLGISDDDLKYILEQVPKINDMTSEEIDEKIDILTYVNCDEEQIRNIIVCNPRYLNKFTDDILKLISYLKKIGLSSLNLLFEANPYFLDYDVFELEDYVSEEIKNGRKLEEIIDEIESNPYIIDEK